MKFKVKFSADFETEIEVPEGGNIWDVVNDIEIPESEGVKYREDSYEVISVVDTDGVEL